MDFLSRICAKSQRTVDSYKNDLRVFRDYISDEKKISLVKFKISDCNKDLILDYIDYLISKDKKPTTINHYISVIKAYLSYIGTLDIKYISLSLAISRIPYRTVPKVIKPVLNDEMLKLLFSLPKKNNKGIRNLTIMILLYDTAIRLDELINIRLSEIFIKNDNPYILVHGKGNKERIVGLSNKAVEHLKYYLSKYHCNNECDYLFYTVIKNKYGKMSESTIETFIQKYADEARITMPDIPKHVHPHMFRRTKATHLYQDGIPLEKVSALLGHSSIETTRIYAKPSLEQLRKIIEQDSDIEVMPEWTEGEIEKLFDF